MYKKSMFALIIFTLIFSLMPAGLHGAKAAGGTIEISVSNANVRSEPSMDSSVVGKAKRNERYTILDEKYDWYQIQLPNNKKGWVAGYLVKTSSSNSQVDKRESKAATIIADRLNVRNQPSLSADIMGKLHIGEQVTATGNKGDWVRIDFHGHHGWVHEQFIRLGSQNEQEVKNQVTSRSEHAVLLYNGTNLRSEPSMESSIVARGSQGESYPVVSREGKWLKVSLPDGREAYLASWIVTVNGKAEQQKPATNQSATGLRGKTIVLDPGHGGIDRGTTGAKGTFEKYLTLQTTQLLYQKLKRSGANVILTRNADSYLSLPSRVAVSSLYEADAFISIHYDSHTESSAKGFTTYYYNGKHRKLASNVHNELDRSLPISDRGIRTGDYHVLRENSQPSILLELGYLSNPREEATVISTPYQELVSNGIYNGLNSYFQAQ
ncbi:N-acetylmuramoyl-L-alanine amidase [Bacillus ectoiniformans]|uniref:N-acetylmuramoyl-L-alanine amidase n=1 Tax=Bacillus ectoiniformans TaxID=1494429 RepID=UPI00195D0897|nr:N-acetylmuramoyl-L-alanine amidase [Bacillus ectoiniformans]MBM7648998.1 N-acetylmuramoyl-L-alanine amidase [Bacillus ectoiniformans]